MLKTDHTQISAPVGSYGTLGHPGNKIYITKTSSGDWRYVDTGHLVEDEDFRAGWDLLYQPECTTGANYFTEATNSGPLMEAEVCRTIAALRREAADTGHCQEFRDQCTKMADQLESEGCEI